MTTAAAGWRERLNPAVLREYASRIRPWGAVAIVIALGLVGWASLLAIHGWEASQDLPPLRSKIDLVDLALADPVPSKEVLEAELKDRTRMLEEWATSFSFQGYPDTDQLLSIIAATAQEAGANITTMVLGQQNTLTQGGVQFQTQSLKVTLNARTHANVFVFLSVLHQKLPIFEVRNTKLGGFGGNPSADIQLFFYLAPELSPEEEPEKEKKK